MVSPDEETKRINTEEASAYQRYRESASLILQTARNLSISVANDLDKLDNMVNVIDSLEDTIMSRVKEKMDILREYKKHVEESK